MTREYGMYEDGGRTREIEPSPFYHAIPGVISRVQMKSLDVRAGNEENPETNILELTVDLQRIPCAALSTGCTRTFRLKTPEAIGGLMRDLEAPLLTDLLKKQVLTHYDVNQSPAYVTISHPSMTQTPKTF